MSQNESTPFLVTDAKNLTLIDATIENSPWCTSVLVTHGNKLEVRNSAVVSGHESWVLFVQHMFIRHVQTFDL